MFIKESYIKQIGPKKFRVYSEKGRNMGTYNSKAGAKKRLREIEYFKHKNSADDNHVFPRGGEGEVPEFFRRNLDYGERNKVLKNKISKLKAAKAALNGLGFKKEAAEIKKSIKSLLLNAFLALGLIGGAGYAANESLENGKLKEIVADFSLEESPNLQEKKAEIPIGATTDQVISTLYPNVPAENQKEIILEFLKEYNPNISFDDGTVKLKEVGFFNTKNRAEVAYPDLTNVMEKFTHTLSDYDPSEVGKAGEMSLSDVGRDFIMSGEGFSGTIYNDKRKFSWPRDRANREAAGKWTIGYGHKLLPDELQTGLIELSPTDIIKWTDGITKEEGIRIKESDISKHNILNSGFNPEGEVTRSAYDSMTDVAFNTGTGALERILQKSNNPEGKFDVDAFSKEIGTWTKVQNPDQRKGILIRRISQILMARGILLPENPEHTKDILQSFDAKMVAPDKDAVRKYIAHFGKNEVENISEDSIDKILKKISITPMSEASDFSKILKTNFNAAAHRVKSTSKVNKPSKAISTRGKNGKRKKR